MLCIAVHVFGVSRRLARGPSFDALNPCVSKATSSFLIERPLKEQTAGCGVKPIVKLPKSIQSCGWHPRNLFDGYYPAFAFTIQLVFPTLRQGIQGTSGWCSISWTSLTDIAAAQHSAGRNRNPGAVGSQMAWSMRCPSFNIGKRIQFLRKKWLKLCRIRWFIYFLY